MAQFTLNLSDELANRLEPLRHKLPELLMQWADNSASQNAFEGEREITPNATAVYDEILDFFLARPSPEAVLKFKISSTAQHRLSILLDKNTEVGLSPAELAELDTYEQLEHLMILLKARAYNSLS